MTFSDPGSPLGPLVPWESRIRLAVMPTTVASLLVIVFSSAIPAASQDAHSQERQRMVEQVRRSGITEASVLQAMAEVPRHRFVPKELQERAYLNDTITIADGSSISMPSLSASMIEPLNLDREDRVLEVGTGSGYDAALLSRIAKEVYTIEIDERLAHRAEATFKELGYKNVHVRVGNGYAGWAEEAPFDAILLTTAPAEVPEELLKQLKVGGRMVVAVGQVLQDLLLITKNENGEEKRRLMPIRLEKMRDP